MIQLLKKALNKLYYITNDEIKLNLNWSNIDFILKQKNFNHEYLYNHNKITEIEHQVGRYLNMKIVIDDLINNKVEGDILEFGTYQGLGLTYFARLLNEKKIEKKLIGIDSFEGLPHSSTIWKKGDFANTELEYVKNNILNYSNLDSENLVLIQGWFNDIHVEKKINEIINDIALVHFDADLYSSTLEALNLIEPYVFKRNNIIYFLFDDWCCHQNEVPDAFYLWLDEFRKKQNFTLEKFATTKLTRYYKLTKSI
jgi:hypothetical protein